MLGRDMEGRPVVYKRFHGGTRLRDMVSLGVSVQKMVRYEEWFAETVLETMGHRGQWTTIFDLQGIRLSGLDSKALEFIRRYIALDFEHYPERLAKCFFINVPGFLKWFCRRVCAFLDARTRQKISILGGPDDWKHALAGTLDLHILPKYFDGAAIPSRGLGG
mmetsp:Transcript_77008/g.200300  ORF Transcript_77008/g.200300 Transcript_77008/m.200300 type:complete len:163 (-) Transcript_77008:12-500(-)